MRKKRNCFFNFTKYIIYRKDNKNSVEVIRIISPGKFIKPTIGPLQRAQAMEQAVDYLESQGIVRIKTSNALTLEDVKRLAGEALNIARQYLVHRFLVDGRGSQIELSILEIDDLPAMFRNIGVDFEDRIAVLYSPLSPKSSLFLFFQNISFLRLLQFRVFSDENKAMAWLKSAA